MFPGVEDASSSRMHLNFDNPEFEKKLNLKIRFLSVTPLQMQWKDKRDSGVPLKMLLGIILPIRLTLICDIPYVG